MNPIRLTALVKVFMAIAILSVGSMSTQGEGMVSPSYEVEGS